MRSRVANVPMLSTLTLWGEDAKDIDFNAILNTKDAKEQTSSLAWPLKKRERERENIDPVKAKRFLIKVPRP